MIYVVGTGFKPVPTEIGKCFFEIKKQFVEKLGKIKEAINIA